MSKKCSLRLVKCIFQQPFRIFLQALCNVHIFYKTLRIFLWALCIFSETCLCVPVTKCVMFGECPIQPSFVPLTHHRVAHCVLCPTRCMNCVLPGPYLCVLLYSYVSCHVLLFFCVLLCPTVFFCVLLELAGCMHGVLGIVSALMK